jgi:hypothetical protein
MERGFAEAEFVSAFKHAWLSWCQADGVVDDRPVDRIQIFNQKLIALAPDARMSARDFSFGIKLREVNFRENI